MKPSFLRSMMIIAVLTAGAVVVSAQTQVSNDLLQTGSGTQENLSSLGLGMVTFQGVALSTDTGAADTIVQHAALPSGGGTVGIQVIALHLMNSGAVTCGNQSLCGSYYGQAVEVHATINVASATNGNISLPQPDALDPSVGSMTVPSTTSPANMLSFDSAFNTIEADIIVVPVGAGVNGTPIFTSPAPAASMSASGGILTTTAPTNYPVSKNFPTVAPYGQQLAGDSAAFVSIPWSKILRLSLWTVGGVFLGLALWMVRSTLKNGRVGLRPAYLTVLALAACLTAWRLPSFSHPKIVSAVHCPLVECKALPVTAEQGALIAHGAAPPAVKCVVITCQQLGLGPG